MEKKKVLIVDDSRFVRKILSRIVAGMGYQVDTAGDGKEAVSKIMVNDYDLVTLDIEMPGMNGIQVLKEIMKRKPTRVIMISSYTTDNAELTLEALNLGAVSYITKPGKLGADLSKIEDHIREKIQEVINLPEEKIPVKSSITPRRENYTYSSGENRFILIGASTGGPKHIEQILSSLPDGYPHSIAIVQHMPAGFTGKFAERLDKVSRIQVVEAKDGEPLLPGKAVIGKGGYHLKFEKNGGGIVCRLERDTNGSLFVPSVDEMFISASRVIPPGKTVAVLLTGIGSDGAMGMLELKKQGAITIAESEETAIVYGMPREAKIKGAAEKVLPLNEIIDYLAGLGAVSHV
ncbi:MAG: chemotaxis-specific protein-glutamate methyltransferase CheB [Aquificae bacterium]|nr:chemotaxis-specific protein-glutamate methyltransferase CheB [Aquificota bacterium]